MSSTLSPSQRRALAERYTGVAWRLGVTTVCYLVVGLILTAIVFGIRSAGGPDPSAWDQVHSTNTFYQVIAGTPAPSHDPQYQLASDIRRLLVANPDPQKALASFKPVDNAHGYSVYRGASDNLDQPLFTESYDEGHLTTTIQPRILSAFQGNLTDLVVSQGPRPHSESHRFFPPLLVLLPLLLSLSLAGFALCLSLEADDSRGEPLSWELDGVATTPKLVVGVLSPLVLTVMLLRRATSTLSSPLRSYLAWRSRLATQRLEIAKVEAATRLEATRLEAAKRAASDSIPDVVRTPYLAARANVERLTELAGLHPDSASIKASLERAREVLSSLSLTAKDAEVADAEAEALALGRASEDLLSSRSAALLALEETRPQA